LISSTGPAGIFSSFPTTGQTKGTLFLNEFLADFVIGIVIWACLDPNNNFMTPGIAPWAIGLIYTLIVWGTAFNTVATNLARDFGSRLAGACFWGVGVFNFDGHYPALSALTNIPATILAVLFYQLVMTDSAALIRKGHATHPEVYRVLTREKEMREREQQRNDKDSEAGYHAHEENGTSSYTR